MADRISHDQNFKNLILDYPREALTFFLPAETPLLKDAGEIIPLRQEQLQERLGTRYRELDVPVMVTRPGGHRDAILFALEEETDSRRFSPHRLVHYCVDLSLLYNIDHVFPVVIFLRDAQAVPRTWSLGNEYHESVKLEYLACELNTMPFEQWQDIDNVVARLNLPNMQYTAEQKVEVYAKAIKGLLTLESDWDKRSKYIEFIDIYAKLTDNELQRFQRQHPEANETMTGIVQRARDEGMEQGMQQGIEQGRVQGIEQGMERGMARGIEKGRVEGERIVLERQLQHRFGDLSPEIVARLAQASRSDLEAWADDVLNAGTLDDVFGRS